MGPDDVRLRPHTPKMSMSSVAPLTVRLPGLSPKAFRVEAVSGLVVALALIPEAIAFLGVMIMVGGRELDLTVAHIRDASPVAALDALTREYEARGSHDHRDERRQPGPARGAGRAAR